MFPVLFFLSLLVYQSLCYGQAPQSEAASAPPEELSVGLLGFRDESGAGGKSGIRKLVDATVRQALFDQGLGPKWIDSDTGTSPIAELAADQLATIGRRRGVKFVVQGLVSAITFDDTPGEVRISVGLEAEVVAVETGVARTVTAESSAITRMADSEQVPALSSVELGNRDFANSGAGRALTRALSNASNGLAESIYTAMTGPAEGGVEENLPQDTRVQDNTLTQDQQPIEGGDVFEPPEGADQTEEEQAAENEEDLQQLIAQADEVVSGNANVDAAQVERLRQLLGQLLQKLEDKSRLLETGDLASTDQIDQAIETEKADLQQAVEQTYSDDNFGGETAPQLRPASSSLLERVTEYVGLTFNVIQKIQELRSSFRQAQNDYAAMEAQPTWEPQQNQPQDQAQAEETAEPEEESLAEINGVVTEDGEPVEGAVITEPLSEQTATTDQFGSYTLKDVPARLSKLLVSRGGKSVAEGRINLLPGRISIADFSLALRKLPGVTRAITGARILPSAVTLVPKIGARPGGTISGVVQDSRGRAMARTLVQLKGLSLARTDSKGRYRFTNVPAGPQLLTALKSGVKFSPQPVQIQARKTVAANIKVAEVMPVVRSNNSLIIDRKTDPLRTGALYGLVTDDKNRPVVGAKVSLSAVSKSRAVTVRTRADGRYDLRGLYPGSYRVIISRVGYADFIRSVTLDAGKKATGNFRLAEMSADSRTKLIERAIQSMGEVRGFVRDANRKGIGRATVEVKRTGASTVNRIGTDGRGKYVLRAFPGSYQLNVTKQGFREASTTVVLRAREPLTKDFQLVPRAVGLKQSDARLGGTGRGLGRMGDGQGSSDSKQSRRREGDTDTRRTDRISTSGMLIERVVPAVAAPGSTIQIYGREFGQIPGPKVVAINGHNKVNVMRIVSWSDSLVRAEIPRELRDGGYLVLIYYDDSYRTSSGSKRIKLAAETGGSKLPFRSKSTPNEKRQRSIDKGALSGDETEARDSGDRISKGGMLIEKLVPPVAGPGSTIEIHGRDFGQIPGNKVVAINAHNRLNVMKIRSWSNTLIRAQIPRDLKGGGYVVLIYYDDSYRTSSNSKTIKVPAAR